MILDRAKFGDNVSDTATGELVSLVFCSSKEADLKVMAIYLPDEMMISRSC